MALKFQTNIPQRMTIEFDQPKEANGQFGVQYMYTVTTEDGQKNWVYASPTLHTILQNVGVQKGFTYIITKVEIGNRSGWAVQDANGVVLHDDSAMATNTPTAQTVQTTAQALPAPHPTPTAAPPAATLADLAKLMERCLKASAWAWDGVEATPEAVNIQATAATLFIAAEKRGLWAEKEVVTKEVVQEVFDTATLPF